MSTNDKKSEFEKLLSSPKEEKWREAVEYRKVNKEWLNLSADIAMKVMDEMDKQGIRGNALADRMGVSPQQVSKILKGRENLKLETIAKLNHALGVKIISIPSEDEIVIKNDVNSLMREVLKHQFKMKLGEVSQHKTDIAVVDKAEFEKDFAYKAEYVTAGWKRKRGQINYEIAA